MHFKPAWDYEDIHDGNLVKGLKTRIPIYRAYKDRYGQSCCDVKDCRPAADFVETVVNGQAVVRLLIDGSWITVARSYVVADYASDGRAHFCGNLHMGGNNPAEVKPEPICVILPPRET